MIDLSDGRERIATMQRMLCMLAAAWKEPDLEVLVSGAWNAETEAAVRAFQERECLPVTGLCGRETWDAMVSCCSAEEERCAPVYVRVFGTECGPGDEGDAVMLLQIVLRGLSSRCAFPPVPLDGRYGAGTEGAVYAFQRIAGLPQTGETDIRTWRALAQMYNEQA